MVIIIIIIMIMVAKSDYGRVADIKFSSESSDCNTSGGVMVNKFN